MAADRLMRVLCRPDTSRAEPALVNPTTPHHRNWRDGGRWEPPPSTVPLAAAAADWPRCWPPGTQRADPP
ncbi:hypothetical protein FNF28_00282 [Cafeteria roenbergensis]|uniref:Uncharacterized protein n=1 Tax=Cafeteria roenbergensis TaxID=33653 RepID=A0A5A8E2D9_CAFRO|nr:hypothetical protein FNF28_00282 [Cafeteria roenbergensis]